MFPIFTRLSCHCASEVIQYLENEKYKYVPCRFTKEQYEIANKSYQTQVNQVDKTPYLSETKKAILISLIQRNMFYKKVLKKK